MGTGDDFLTKAKDKAVDAVSGFVEDPLGSAGSFVEETFSDPYNFMPGKAILDAGEMARDRVQEKFFPGSTGEPSQDQGRQLTPDQTTAIDIIGQNPPTGGGGFGLPTKASLSPKKGSGTKTAFEVEASAPIPDWLNQLSQRSMKRMADWDYLDKITRAHALGAVGDLQKELAHQTDKQYGKSMKDMGQLLDTAEQEIAAVDDLIDAARSNRINPGQFFANVGEAGKFAAALSVGAGAMASAFGGGPNVAFDIIQKAIDRNVRAQVVNQAHDRAMISHQLNFVNAIRGLAQDQGSYGNLIRLGLNAVAQARIAEVMSGTSSVLYANAGRSVYDRLNAQVIQARINQIASTKYKFKHSWNNWRKTLAIQQSVLGAMSGGGVPQRGGGRAPAALGPGQEPRRGTAPSAGGGEAQQAKATGRTVGLDKKDKALVERAIARAMRDDALFGEASGKDPKKAAKRAQAMADALKLEASNVPGQVVTRDMKQYLWETFGSGLPGQPGEQETSASPELAQAIKGLNDIEFAAQGQVPSRTISIPGIGKRPVYIENLDQYNESDKKRAVQRISSAARGVAYTRRLKQLLGIINKGGKLSDVVRRTGKGELIFPISGGGTITEAKAMAELKAIQETLISDSQALESGRNALDKKFEIIRQERKTGAKQTLPLEIRDVLGLDGPFKSASEMDAYIEMQDNALRGAAAEAGMYIRGDFNAVLEKELED